MHVMLIKTLSAEKSAFDKLSFFDTRTHIMKPMTTITILVSKSLFSKFATFFEICHKRMYTYEKLKVIAEAIFTLVLSKGY